MFARLTIQNILSIILCMSIATVVIPIAPSHVLLANDAIASAEAQTIPIDIVTYFDKDSGGAGYSRNQATQKTNTPFVIYLDADDILMPTFVEDCVQVYRKGHFVYTPWEFGNGVIGYPDPVYPLKGKYGAHVTSLFPTAAVKAIGGFDETLPGDEDFDFIMRLMQQGLCPIYLNKPLFIYREHGQVSKKFYARADAQEIHNSIFQRNGGMETIMCCGNEGLPAPSNPGQKQEGDVLAIATWGGIQTVASVTGARTYRGGNGGQMWVAQADVEQQPKMFRRTYSVADLTPDKQDVLKSSGLI